VGNVKPLIPLVNESMDRDYGTAAVFQSPMLQNKHSEVISSGIIRIDEKCITGIIK